MEVLATPLPGLMLLAPRVFVDRRGFLLAPANVAVCMFSFMMNSPSV